MDDNVMTDRAETEAPTEKASGETDNGVQQAIGKQVRAYYDDVASEPIPDKFLSLLDALDAAESSSGSADRG